MVCIKYISLYYPIAVCIENTFFYFLPTSNGAVQQNAVFGCIYHLEHISPVGTHLSCNTIKQQ